MRERVIIVFIAIAIGLIVTTLIYFLYQQTKTIPQKVADNQAATPTPTPTGAYLVVTTPADQSISDRRSIQIKGKTTPHNIIVISTNQEDNVINPTSDGGFTASITIDAGANKIITRSIAPDGSETTDVRVVTFSTEDF